MEILIIFSLSYNSRITLPPTLITPATDERTSSQLHLGQARPGGAHQGGHRHGRGGPAYAANGSHHIIFIINLYRI